LILAMTDEQHNQRLLNRQDPATVQAVVASFVDNPAGLVYQRSRLSIDINGEFDPGSGRTLAA
jgi:hypothetical protein